MTVAVQILRRASRDAEPHWEEFRVEADAGANIISVLMAVRERPVTAEGGATTPVAYDASCLEDMCGACSMVINGRPRQACSTLVQHLEQPIRIEPLRKFPVVRDLVVDRSRALATLTRVKAWTDPGATDEPGGGPPVAPELQQQLYRFSRCFSCGICLEVCPIYRTDGEFIGAMAAGQAWRFNRTGGKNGIQGERAEFLAGPGHIGACDNDQSCQRSCPKEIPLAEAIGDLKREAAWGWF